MEKAICAWHRQLAENRPGQAFSWAPGSRAAGWGVTNGTQRVPQAGHSGVADKRKQVASKGAAGPM